MKASVSIGTSVDGFIAWVLIGAGTPLFGPLQRDIALKHVATRHYASGLVQSEYVVSARQDGYQAHVGRGAVDADATNALGSALVVRETKPVMSFVLVPSQALTF